jgi:hypothetical protein
MITSKKITNTVTPAKAGVKTSFRQKLGTNSIFLDSGWTLSRT